MATNIGTGPQDIPLNQFLGEMAFMDSIYSQGNYSPTIDGWTGTYIIQDGTWTKIGRRVTVQGQIRTSGGTGTFTNSFPLIECPFPGTGVDPANDVAGTWNLASGASSTLTSSTSVIGAGVFDGPGAGSIYVFPNCFQVGNGIGNFSSSNLDPNVNVEFRFTMGYNI